MSAAKRTKSAPSVAPFPFRSLPVRWLPWLPALLGFALYINTLLHDFALDDAIVLTENMFTREGFSGIYGLLSHDTFYGFFKEEGKAQLVAGGRYRPLTPVLFALETGVFGVNPMMGHLFNALWYAALCVVLFFTLRTLLGPARGENAAVAISLLAALLFAAHPLHSEAVANIKGRDEIITLLCCLLAWWATLRSLDERRPVLMGLAAIALFLGLMAKEHAIGFLAVIPASLWFFRPSIPLHRYAALWPLLLAALVFLLIRGAVIGWQMGEAPMEMLNNPFIKVTDGRYLPFTTSERWATISYTLLLYLKLLIWPWPLTHDYYPRHIPVMDFTHPGVWLGLLLHVVLVVLVIRGLRRRSLFAFAALYYLSTLFILSNILFPVGTTMSERFLFMPSVGFALVLAAASRVPENPGLKKSTTLLLLGIMAVWSAVTVVRNPVWKDNYTLFLHDVQTSKNSAKLRNAAGGELIARAVLPENADQREGMLRQAVGHLQQALIIHPAYKNACLLMGNAHNYLQEYDTAIDWYRKALALDPGYKEALNNLHITYRDAGRYFGEVKGDLSASLRYLGEANALQPGDFETLRLLGIAHGISGHHGEAVRYFTLALEKSPENADLMVYLGNAHMHLGQTEEARRWHARAEALEPGILTRMGIPVNR